MIAHCYSWYQTHYTLNWHIETYCKVPSAYSRTLITIVFCPWMLLNEHNSPYFLYSPYRLKWSIFCPLSSTWYMQQLNCLCSLQSFVSFFLVNWLLQKRVWFYLKCKNIKNNIYLYFPHRNEWVTHFWHPGFVLPHDRLQTQMTCFRLWLFLIMLYQKPGVIGMSQ